MQIPTSLIAKNRLAQNALSGLAGRTVAQAIPDLSKLSQQEAGGVLRTVANGTLGTFGQAATVAGAESYDAYSAWAISEKVAKDSYKPTILTGLSSIVAQSADPLIGHSMVKFQQGMFEDAATALTAGVMREVTNLFRQTVAENANRDSRVKYYQRVASPTSCAFCLYVATQAANSSWANDDGYHDHCGCSTVPVFSAADEYRPAYYEDFADDVGVAQREIRDVSRQLLPERVGMRQKQFFAKYPEAAMNTENILARIRASTGRA